MDERTARHAELAGKAGWIAVETDPEAASVDGPAVPPAPQPRRFAEWPRALLQALADDRASTRTGSRWSGSASAAERRCTP